MPRLTKKLLSEVWARTTTCYRKALRDEYPGLFNSMTDEEIETNAHDQNFEVEMKVQIMDAMQPYRSPSINNRYLEYLLKLDSKTLSLVIQAHQAGKQRRAEVTIDAILNELFERSINGEKK